MSIRALLWAYEHPGVKRSADKLVLIALGNYANQDNRAWPSARLIARETCLAVATVRRALQRLEAEGFLSRADRKRPDGSVTSPVFTLLGVPERGAEGVVQNRIGGLPKIVQGGSTKSSRRTEPQEEPQEDPPSEGAVEIDYKIGPHHVDPALWGAWLDYRTERGLPLTPAAYKLQLDTLNRLGPTQARDAIREAIDRGYRGIITPKRTASATGGRGGAAPARKPTESERSSEAFARGHFREDTEDVRDRERSANARRNAMLDDLRLQTDLEGGEQ